MLKRIVKGLELVQIKTPFLEIFQWILLGTLGILVLLRTHTTYENSEMTTDLLSQQLILMASEMWGNESRSAFPTSNSGTNCVSALQLGPRGAWNMHFFSQHLRNSLERELVFVANTLSYQVMTYLCLCLLELFQKTFCDHMHQDLSQEVWFSDWHRSILHIYTDSFSSLAFQTPFPQCHLQSLEWILSSLFPKGFKDSIYFLSFCLLECSPWRVSFCCCNTVSQ